MPVTNDPPDEDPTTLTQAAVERSASATRDYVDGQIGILKERLRVEREKCEGQFHIAVQRFVDMDKATELLSATVNRVPTDLQTAIRDVMRLMDERDHRVAEHFDAIKRLRESENNLNQTALQAALAAQEKATAVSSASLDRTIEKNAELAAQSVNALSARVTQVSDQVIRSQQQVAEILAGSQAVVAQKTDTRGGAAGVYGLVGAVVSGLSAIIAAVAIIIATR
jgi:hypothetical protein